MIAEDVRLELSRSIERELAFLQSAGFRFEGVQENTSDAVGASLERVFTNQAVNRAVRVVYLPGHNAPHSVMYTSVNLLVGEPLDDFDYTSLHWMEVCVTELSRTGSGAEDFEQHVRDVVRLLKERFAEVLAGLAWESHHLDWRGLKQQAISPFVFAVPQTTQLPPK